MIEENPAPLASPDGPIEQPQPHRSKLPSVGQTQKIESYVRGGANRSIAPRRSPGPTQNRPGPISERVRIGASTISTSNGWSSALPSLQVATASGTRLRTSSVAATSSEPIRRRDRRSRRPARASRDRSAERPGGTGVEGQERVDLRDNIQDC